MQKEARGTFSKEGRKKERIKSHMDKKRRGRNGKSEKEE